MKELMKELAEEKREAIDIAKELGYLSKFPGMKERIRSAKTVTEIDRVLITARHALCN